MKKENVFVIGGGGREHALIWKLSQSPRVNKIFCAPGIKGVPEIVTNVNIGVDDFNAQRVLAETMNIGLTVVGPEQPLVGGVVNNFKNMKPDLIIFGPDKAGAQLEGSKIFAKDFMEKYGIPTAEYKVFDSFADAEKYVKSKGAPIVVKADGLAGGKGVIVTETVDEAVAALKQIMIDKKFGDAGNKVVIEECLKGEEVSFMILIDGTTVMPLATSQDHKREFDGDKGRNTGGMGAYSPAPIVTDALRKVIMQDIIDRITYGLRQEKINYRGVIYVGLMISAGKPYVLEFNVRFGDPEAQPILRRLDSDLFELLKTTAEGRLKDVEVKWKDKASVCVVMASKGYPGPYVKGKIITGIEEAEKDGIVIFHAGTKKNDGKLVNSGGRVLGVTALGSNILDAKVKAYNAVGRIKCENDNLFCRFDIGDKAIKRK